jgi:cysteine desulfurase
MNIYLDNNATTGLDPLVLEAMLHDLNPTPANPSSSHLFGQEARSKLSRARHTIASLLKVKPLEVIFTSGGTEALNMLIRGLHRPGTHIITSDVEHAAVFHTLKSLEKARSPVSYLPAGLRGCVAPDAIQNALQPHTGLIVLSAVNNETGVKIDLDAIAHIAHAHKIPFIVDGVALLGKERFSLPEGVSAIAFSGHKIHAPKGIGVAVLRSHLKLDPLFTGGDQEYAKRAGTENLSGILGFAKAIELAYANIDESVNRMRELRDRLEQTLMTRLENVQVNGEGPRICNTSNLSFLDIDGEDLLMHLDQAGIAVSHGSACSSGALEPSRILMNMGIPKQRSRSSVRFSLSRWTTAEEIDICIDTITHIISRLSKLTR